MWAFGFAQASLQEQLVLLEPQAQGITTQGAPAPGLVAEV